VDESRRLFDSYGLSEAQTAEAFQRTRGRAALLDAMAGSTVAQEKSSGNLSRVPQQVFA
jgi:hypothetical protein